MGKAAAADDDRFAIRQRPPDGLERFAAHNNCVAGGDLLEPFEIVGQMPWNLVAAADDSIGGHGCDNFKALH